MRAQTTQESRAFRCVECQRLLAAMVDTEEIRLEPSALAGVAGPVRLFRDSAGQTYLEENDLKEKMKNATHICWATGGSMVPKDVMDAYYHLASTEQKV